MGIAIVLFLLGFILVVKGGDWFVDSSVSISRISGLPEIFIGATIVSIATTLPEVIVSSTAAIKGHTTMSVGNGVGSMICNIGLILGFTTLLKPTRTGGRVFRYKSLLVVIYTSILIFISLDRVIDKSESLILLLMLGVYIGFNTLILRKKRTNGNNKRIVADKRELTSIIFYFILGLGGIIAGSNLLINNGIILAEVIGVPEAIISLTLIALGTSLPELVTALTALRKGNTSLSVGNIIGANILNITMVLGISSAIAPLTIIKQNLVLDMPVAGILTVFLILPSLITKKVSRIQGILLLLVYFAYLLLVYGIYL